MACAYSADPTSLICAGVSVQHFMQQVDERKRELHQAVLWPRVAGRIIVRRTAFNRRRLEVRTVGTFRRVRMGCRR